MLPTPFRILLPVILILLSGFAPLSAQSPAPVVGRRLVAILPLGGAGTWADPKRPLFPEVSGNEPLEYRWLPSDDGQFAIVEFGFAVTSKESLEKLDRIAASKAPGVKVFERGKHTKDEVEREVRKFRKNFELEEFLGGRKGGGAK